MVFSKSACESELKNVLLSPLLHLSRTGGPVVPCSGMEITRNRNGEIWAVGWMSNRQYLALFQKITDNIGDVRSHIILMQNPQMTNLRSFLINMFLESFEDLHILNGTYFCLRWNYMLVNDTMSVKKHA